MGKIADMDYHYDYYDFIEHKVAIQVIYASTIQTSMAFD